MVRGQRCHEEVDRGGAAGGAVARGGRLLVCCGPESTRQKIGFALITFPKFLNIRLGRTNHNKKDNDTMRINFITHESADGVPRRWLRTEVYPKTFPELVSEATNFSGRKEKNHENQ